MGNPDHRSTVQQQRMSAVSTKASYSTYKMSQVGTYQLLRTKITLKYTKLNDTIFDLLFVKASVFPICQPYKFGLLLQSHKVFHSKPTHSIHNHNTHQENINLPLPLSKIARGHRRVEYQSWLMWNKRP